MNNVKLIDFNETNFNTIHQQIVNKFKIKNLSKIHYYLNMKVIYNHQQ